jgi:ABC-type Zn uptake system ZnuABC Zn-binding protein ZnuA
MKYLKIAALVITAAFLLAGCGNQSRSEAEAETSEKLQITAANSILADLAENVTGDLAEVHSIVPRGVDPHEYEVLPEDIRKASDADIILANGLNLETGNGWFEQLMETANKEEDTDYFFLGNVIEPIYLTSNGQSDNPDPHAWLDLSNGIKYVEEINRIVSKKDPENKEIYQENTENYVEKLKALDESGKEKIQAIPEKNRLLVTSEGAFKYFAKAYGIDSAYIWEINTESQGTPEQMKAVINRINETSIPALFLETSVDKRSLERVSNETGVPIYDKIFTDSLAEKGTDGDNYYDMMKWNLEKISAGLSQE